MCEKNCQEHCCCEVQFAVIVMDSDASRNTVKSLKPSVLCQNDVKMTEIGLNDTLKSLNSDKNLKSCISE